MNSYFAALAEQHHDELRHQADRARLARQARSPRPTAPRRRLTLPRLRRRPVAQLAAPAT
jgi:hypothetical protein